MSNVLRSTLVLSLLAAVTASACGDGKSKPNSSKIAAAFENSIDPKANAKKADEDMRRLKEKVAADTEAAVLAEIDKITTPAADAPNDIKAACEGMRGAYDQFMQKRLVGDKVELDRWNVMKPLDLDKVVEACVTGNQATFRMNHLEVDLSSFAGQIESRDDSVRFYFNKKL